MEPASIWQHFYRLAGVAAVHFPKEQALFTRGGSL